MVAALLLGLFALALADDTPEPQPVPSAEATLLDEAPATTASNESKPTPGIRKLDRKSQAKVMSAFAAFVILWLAIIIFIWLGARYTRRYMAGTPGKASKGQTSFEEDDWARKKLVPETEEEG
jgi:hypothetical protein